MKWTFKLEPKNNRIEPFFVSQQKAVKIIRNNFVNLFVNKLSFPNEDLDHRATVQYLIPQPTNRQKYPSFTHAAHLGQ